MYSGGDWQIWECLDTPVTTVTLQKLVKGQEYQFRVIAINKAGRSDPSVASRPKMAKETDCKYQDFLYFCEGCIDNTVITFKWCPTLMRRV